MSSKPPTFEPPKLSGDVRVAIVAARFNEQIVEKLLNGCQSRLVELGVKQTRVEVNHVPGAFELPLGAKMLASTKRFDAIICLGCVIRGDTPHFDYVAGEAARGIQDVALAEKLPVIFGVLTCDTEQQALDRAGGQHGHAGQRAAEAAVEMIALVQQIRERN